MKKTQPLIISGGLDCLPFYRENKNTKPISGGKMKKILVLAVFIFFSFSVSASFAQRAFVTDSFKITLRKGPGNDNKIIALLPSGQQIDIIEKKGDWTHVRLPGPDGKEGWVVSGYVIYRLPWEKKSKELEKENEKLKKKLNNIEQQWENSSEKEKRLSQELIANRGALEKIKDNYRKLKNDSSEFLKLKAEHEKSLKILSETENRLDALLKETEGLRSSQKNRWFATGALVLLCGLLIGALVGRQQKKRKSTYY